MTLSLILPNRLALALVHLVDVPHERLGYLLTRRTDKGLLALESIFVDTGENETHGISSEDEADLRDFANRYLLLARSNPDYHVVSSHIHGRPFGESVRQDDPYWSVKSDTNGRVVDGRFYLTTRGGDDIALRGEHDKYGIRNHLFIHPAFGSEGQIMDVTLSQLTHFAYDATQFGLVRELPLEVVR